MITIIIIIIIIIMNPSCASSADLSLSVNMLRSQTYFHVKYKQNIFKVAASGRETTPRLNFSRIAN